MNKINHEIEASCHFIKLKRDKKSWKDLLITWLGGNVPDFLSKLVINNYLPRGAKKMKCPNSESSDNIFVSLFDVKNNKIG